MSTQLKTNEFGQQFIALPLTLRNVGSSVVVVDKIFVRNNVTGLTPLHLNFTIDELKSDYSLANIINQTDYSVQHIPIDAFDLSKNFKVQNRFSLNPSGSFTFHVIFDPNVSRFSILKGNYVGSLHIEMDNNLTESFTLNLNATCSDKEIALFSGVDFNSISSVLSIERSRIISVG